jgi:hypothetical protein
MSSLRRTRNLACPEKLPERVRDLPGVLLEESPAVTGYSR